jgi:hypothetical protein
MIIGSRKIPITPHGIIAYSALAAMIVDVVSMWNARLKKAGLQPLSKALHRYSISAYIWWIVVYIAGALMVMLAK